MGNLEENLEDKVDQKKKGAIVYLIPNLFTSANLFLGFFSIVSSTKAVESKEWVASAVAIMIAAITDGIDGRVARLTKTETLFGEQFDSMSDLVSFGVAPAILVYEWGLSPYGKYGWMAAFLFLLCAALRLTRFNVLKQSEEKRYFQGLPSPVAASIAASAVLFHEQVSPFQGKDLYILFVMIFIAISMVSTIRYRSFKDIKIKSQEGFGYLLIIVMVVMLITMEPEVLIFPVGVLYLISGPIGAMIRFIRPEPEELEVPEAT